MSTNGITNAVARLTRAGGENSRTTEKLKDAAAELAAYVWKIAPQDVELPRGYALTSPWAGWAGLRLCRPETFDSGDIGGPDSSRRSCMAFAEDVADGWLDELSALLEFRALEADRAAGLLAEKAAEVRGTPCVICAASRIDTPGTIEIVRDADRDGVGSGRVFACPDCVAAGAEVRS